MSTTRRLTLTVPCEAPIGRKEIGNLEAHILARIPRDFVPFRDQDVGLGTVFYTQRGVSNTSATWYWSKVRKALVKCGIVGAMWEVWVLHSRVLDTAQQPRIEITLCNGDALEEK